VQIEAVAGTARERVFQAILARGPLTATVIAAELGVTPAAVRRHIDSLEDDGLVVPGPLSAGSAPRGRGRPARSYVVSGAGQRAAQSGYEEFALAAISHLSRTHGEAAVAAFVSERTRELEQRWAEQVELAGPDPLARVEALADVLDGEGYAAGVRRLDAPRVDAARGGTVVSGAQLCQGHCPVSALATLHPDICEAETRAFSRLIGVHVQRLATIAHGDHVCTTFVPLQGVPS